MYNAKTSVDTAEFEMSRTLFTDVMKLNDSEHEKLEGKNTYDEAYWQY